VRWNKSKPTYNSTRRKKKRRKKITRLGENDCDPRNGPPEVEPGKTCGDANGFAQFNERKADDVLLALPPCICWVEFEFDLIKFVAYASSASAAHTMLYIRPDA
jgi:hypothetical protein